VTTSDRAAVTVVVEAADTVVGAGRTVAVAGVVTNAAWLARSCALMRDWERETLSRVWMAGLIVEPADALNLRKVV
jgi:hypothetical protein